MLQHNGNINNWFVRFYTNGGNVQRKEKEKSRRYRDFWVANGARTHDPQNHNLML
jgi:hypothetical protein